LKSPIPRTAVLVDDYPLWLEAVAEVTERAGLEVVQATTSVREARDALADTRPDLLVTEISVRERDLDGLSLIRYARDCSRETRAIVLSVHEDAEHVEAAFEAGAVAYVLKSAHPDDVGAAIRQAFGQSIFLSSDRISTNGSSTAPTAGKDHGLTRRELEILGLVAEGHSNAELARMLWVTEQTVKFHLSNIYRKLGVANRTEASHWALVQGVLTNRVGRLLSVA
jgi:DNA-binding NarL/FixJ family response regulator